MQQNGGEGGLVQTLSPPENCVVPVNVHEIIIKTHDVKKWVKMENTTSLSDLLSPVLQLAAAGGKNPQITF